MPKPASAPMPLSVGSGQRIRATSRKARVTWPRIVATVTLVSIAGGLEAQPHRASLEARGAYRFGNLMTPEVRRAVDDGLAWLAAHQDPRGFWYATTGRKGNDWRYHNYNVEVTAAEQRRRGCGHMGVTALAGMAFLAGGHVPGRGEYGVLVQRTLDYILDHIAENGMIRDSGTRMYSHALATLFLAEVYGMSRERRIRKGLERATHVIVDGQNPRGGWRYYLFSPQSDLSITVCQLQALRAARNIGIQIPKDTIDRAVEYIKRSRVRDGSTKGLYFYRIFEHGSTRGWSRDRSRQRWGRGPKRKDDHFAINSAAVTALVSAGVHDPELLGPPVDFILKRLPDEIDEFGHHYQFWYGNYYACQALYHADRLVRKNAFESYFRVITEHLIEDQESDGRWLNDEGPGDPFATAVACIVLQVPMQYLPIFQR